MKLVQRFVYLLAKVGNNKDVDDDAKHVFFYQVSSSTGGDRSSLPLSSDRTGIPQCFILCNKIRTSPSLLPLLMFLTC